MRKVTYETMRDSLHQALDDLSMLAGDTVGPSGVTWQDIAGTCAVNLRSLASQIELARDGLAESPVVFPGPDEWACDRT